MLAIPVRQSTAQIVTIGPFVDLTDGVTPETGLTLGAMGSAKIIKAGAGAAVSISGLTWAHIDSGVYNLSLDTGATDTLGRLRAIFSQPATFRGPVTQEFVVLSAHVYDSLVAYSAQLGVDVIALDGDASAATAFAQAAATIVPLIVQASSTVTVINTDLTSATDDFYNGRSLVFSSVSRRKP